MINVWWLAFHSCNTLNLLSQNALQLCSKPIHLIPLGLIINSLIISSFIILFFLGHKWTQALNCFITPDTKSLISEVFFFLARNILLTSGSICCRHASWHTWVQLHPSCQYPFLIPTENHIRPMTHWMFDTFGVRTVICLHASVHYSLGSDE